MMRLKIFAPICVWLLVFGCQPKPQPIEKTNTPQKTYCNPIDISYRFGMEEPSRREAADPTVVWFRDRYFLFASKSGGYWHSLDLSDWQFIATDQIPTEEYAPTAIAIDGTLYFLASSNDLSKIYRSSDPLSGQWEVAKDTLQQAVWDPTFFMDDEQKLYLYWGCSDRNPIYGVELDYKNDFEFLDTPKALLQANTNQNGWEVPGDDNTRYKQAPWIEGAWMNKIGDQYYLQYSGPGTEYKSYSDGVFVSKNPLGPFELQKHNPFAYKPEGFAAGAGHGSTFQDRYGNFWHIGTITISQKHMFERRLGLFPAFVDQEGELHASTYFGDYPMTIPDHKIESVDEIFTHSMLLSYNKKITASSAIDSLPVANANDENIRTYWAAASGDAGEYLQVELGDPYDVNAIQINFAEHETSLFGRTKNRFHQYTVESSLDGQQWEMIADRSNNQDDKTHVYITIEEAKSAVFVRVTNVQVPDGHFAISDLRVFGKGNGPKPQDVKSLTTKRWEQDRRAVTLSWEESPSATGYNISFGIAPDKLYQNYMVYDQNELTIHSLNAQLDYYFIIEAFNENGISEKSEIAEAK